MQIALIVLISPDSGNRILNVLFLKLLDVQTTLLHSITEASSIFQYFKFTGLLELSNFRTSFKWIILFILVICFIECRIKQSVQIFMKFRYLLVSLFQSVFKFICRLFRFIGYAFHGLIYNSYSFPYLHILY